MNPEEINKQLIRGTGLAALFRIAQFAIQFISNFIIVDLLIPSELGLYRWIVAFMSYGMLTASLGMNEIVSKYSVNFGTSKDFAKKITLLRDAYILRNIACVLVFIILYIFILPTLIKNSSFSEMAVIGIKIIYILGLSSILSSNIDLSIRLLDAEFKFVNGRLIEFMNITAQSILKIALIHFFGLIGVAIGTFFGVLITFLITEYLTKRNVFDLLKNVSKNDQHLFRLILSESFFLLIILTIAISFDNLDLVLLGFLASPEEIGYYAFAKFMSGTVLSLFLFAGPMLYPYLIKKQIENEENNFIKKILKYVPIFSCFIFGAVISFGEIAIRIFLPKYLPAYPLFFVLMISIFYIPYSSYIIGPIINQHRKYLWQAKVMIGMLVFLILSIFLLVSKIGIIGASVAVVLVQGILHIILVKKSLQLIGMKFKIQNILKPLISMIIPLTFIYLNSHFIKFIPVSTAIIFFPILYFGLLIVLSGIEKEDLRYAIKIIQKIF